MVSPIRELSSSQEGMESFLATLSRTSLSPRGRLLTVIDSADPAEIAAELVENATSYSALELAVCIYAVLQHHNPQSVAHSLASGILTLTSRFSSNHTCSYSTWNQLLSLLSKKPPVNKLCVFLQSDEDNDNSDELDSEFTYKTSSELARIYDVSHMGLHDIMLTECIEPWISKKFPESPDCISSLLLAYYLCKPHDQSDQWDLQSVSQSPAAQDFVLRAISKCDDPEKVQELLAAFRDVLEDDSWRFVQSLMPASLDVLAHILHIDPTASLAILDNTASTWTCRLTVASRVLSSLRSVNSSLLFALFSKLAQATHDDDDATKQSLKVFLEFIANKPWHYDAIAICDEHPSYKEPVNKFINGDIRTILQVLYEDNPKYCSRIGDKIIRKILSAVVSRLIEFAEQNKMSLLRLDSIRQDYRTQMSVKIKTEAISLAFFLYDAIASTSKKKKVFTYLKKETRHLQTTLSPSENKVQKVYNQGAVSLVYADGSTVYRINNPTKKLPTHTPRTDGIPVD